MQITGIIAEYNPFHKGHLYHLTEARKQTDADYIIVVMSGDFMQRGTPALLDKYTRTHMALLCGVDLVLELPVIASTGSAEFFSHASVRLLDSLGAVNSLFFGSECGDISKIKQAASVLSQESEEFRFRLREGLSEGLSFPKARALALGDEEGIFSSPNNILGLEYCKSLLRLKSPMEPVTLCRKGAGYHQDALDDGEVFPSAKAIRSFLLSPSERKISASDKEKLFSSVPEAALPVWEEILGLASPPLLEADDFSSLLCFQLMRLTSFSSETAQNDLTVYADISRELSDKLSNLMPGSYRWEELCGRLKTKELTYTRISRSLCHILLSVTAREQQLFHSLPTAPYARILGFRKESAPLFTQLKKKTHTPLISRLADAKKILSPESMAFLEKDLFASHIYQSVSHERYGTSFQNEYQRKMLIVDDSTK